MALTTNLKLPYPTSSDAPNGPQQIQDLATGLDTKASLTWTQPTLSGFTHFAGNELRYAKDMFGFVRFRGSIRNNSSFTAPSATIFTLPAGFRPADENVTFSIAMAKSPYNANVNITIAGLVTISDFASAPAAVNTRFHFDGIAAFFAGF